MKTLITIVALLSCSAAAQVNSCSVPELLEHELLTVTPLEQWLQLSEGQVENTCGPGKTCFAKNFVAAAAVNVTRGFCVSDTSTSLNLATYATGHYGLVYHSGSRCNSLALAYPAFSVATTAGYVGVLNSNWYVQADSGFAAPKAFASLPTCNAGTDDRLMADSTSHTWRRCRNGSGWLPVGNISTAGESLTAYHPGIAGLLNLPVNRFTWPRELFVAGPTSNFSTFTVRIDSAVTLVAGVGAGNAVYTLYNFTDTAATAATVTVPCASAAGTVTAGGSDSSLTIFGATKDFELRLTTNGCGTLPIVNLTASWVGVPTGT